MPIIAWGVMAVAGAWGVGWAAQETGEAADSLSQLTKWAAVAGGVYVTYKVLQGQGAFK
jgi:hypothetical protein